MNYPKLVWGYKHSQTGELYLGTWDDLIIDKDADEISWWIETQFVVMEVAND